MYTEHFINTNKFNNTKGDMTAKPEICQFC